MSAKRAAVLAIGTEVTDGQIIDRNSAWISQQLVNQGIEVIEHRSVADDRAQMNLALKEMSSRLDLLFVTGGLGPTSDDFTREVLADFFKLPLQFDEASWKRIEERFAARGVVARPIQRQQCYFPRGSDILVNSSGTANAFSFTNQNLKIYALPGPPLEIATVWEDHIAREIEKLVPENEREKLFILRTLGRGEGDIAEKTENVIQKLGRDSGIRVGYRAHLPYVEVKIWYRADKESQLAPFFKALEEELSEWIVSRNQEDLIDHLVDEMLKKAPVLIADSVSNGFLQSRLMQRLEDKKIFDADKIALHPVTITSHLMGDDQSSAQGPSRERSYAISFSSDIVNKNWKLSLLEPNGQERETVIEPTPLYAFGTPRGRKYATERAFQWLKFLSTQK